MRTSTESTRRRWWIGCGRTETRGSLRSVTLFWTLVIVLKFTRQEYDEAMQQPGRSCLRATPVTGEHARMQFLLGAELERQLGGRAWGEQGIRQADGPPLVPDVMWADAAFFDLHKASGILPGAPRLCVEVMSASNDPEQLRAKCKSCLTSGAEETWIVEPAFRAVEIHDRNGVRERSALGLDFAPVWAKL